MTTQVSIHPGFSNHRPAARATTQHGRSATQRVFQFYGRLWPEKAGNLVNRMAFRPSRLPMPSKYEYLLDTVDGYTQLQHGALTVPVYSWGQGPVILGVHGWSGAGIQFGAWIDPLVEAGYRVVLFDAPAHGRAQGYRTDLFDMADVVHKVAASVGQVHGILAHSMGCLAVARAVSQGLQAEHLVMLAPPVSLGAIMGNLGAQLGLSENVLNVHLSLMEQQFGTDVWEQLDMERLAGQLTQRGLVVIDADDRSIAPEDSLRVHEHWPRSAVLKTRGLGHHKMLSSPVVIESALKDLGPVVDLD